MYSKCSKQVCASLFLSAGLSAFVFFFFQVHAQEETYFSPRLYQSIWPDFCLEHLQQYPQECSAHDTDDKGNLVKMVVKVGAKVMYKKWGGNEVKVNGEEWTIVEQKDILAIVE